MIEHLTADATVSLMSLVVVARSEGVATLTLNNPGERNTLTAAMVEEIHPPSAPKCSSSKVLAPSANVSSASSYRPS